MNDGDLESFDREHLSYEVWMLSEAAGWPSRPAAPPHVIAPARGVPRFCPYGHARALRTA